jgi:DNA repair exonuclease SbcCD ATPase subunit
MRFVLTLVALFAVGLGACGSAAEEKAKLAELQKKADERVAQAERQANVKLEEVKRDLAAARSELAIAKAQTKEAVDKAQASAEEHANAAEAALAKARQAFKDKARLELSAANKDLTEFQAKLAKAPQKTKTALAPALKEIKKAQQAVGNDITGFDKATVDTLRTVNTKVQQDIIAFKAKIRAAAAKLP